jgi:hypothetical protein
MAISYLQHHAASSFMSASCCYTLPAISRMTSVKKFKYCLSARLFVCCMLYTYMYDHVCACQGTSTSWDESTELPGIRPAEWVFNHTLLMVTETSTAWQTSLFWAWLPHAASCCFMIFSKSFDQAPVASSLGRWPQHPEFRVHKICRTWPNVPTVPSKTQEKTIEITTAMANVNLLTRAHHKILTWTVCKSWLNI